MPQADARRIAVQLRRAKAIELKKAGATYRQIAEQLGVCTHTAWRDVELELRTVLTHMRSSVDTLRELELQRLDRMQVALWPKAVSGESTRAIGLILRIMERRSALLGLDAPKQVQVAGGLEVTAMFSQAAEGLAEKLARLPVIDVTPQIAQLALSTGSESGNGRGNGTDPHAAAR